MAKPSTPLPKADWTISDSQMVELEKKWSFDQSQMSDLEIGIRIVELVMKERYGPEIQKIFDELEEKLDSAIANHNKAGEDLNSMKSILQRFRSVADGGDRNPSG